MKKVTIDLNTWVSWGNTDNRKLGDLEERELGYGCKEVVHENEYRPRLRSDQGMCCLGFVCNQALEIPEFAMWGYGSPSDLGLRCDHEMLPSDLTADAMDINDGRCLSTYEKMSLLTCLFSDYGIDLHFVQQ